MSINNSPIQEIFTLPSHGKIYVEDVKENFTMRSMTINEEMQRLAHSDHKYELLCNIIDKCMVDSPGISSYDMCIGDYIYCLYMLRIATYGPEYKIQPTCNYCKSVNKSTFNLHDLKINEYTPDIEKYVEFNLPVCKSRVTIQPSTPRMLDNIEDRINMYKRKIQTNMDSAIMCQLMSAIRLVDGVELNEIKLEEFVRSLSMADVNTIQNYEEKLNTSIGVDNSLIIECDYCGLTQETRLAITSEFFRPTLDI